jgi:DNA-binding transcriptional MerR regulator
MSQEWIGVSEAAKLSGKSGSTIRRWCDDRIIKNKKLKKGRKIYKKSLLEHLVTEAKPTPSRSNHDTPKIDNEPSHLSHLLCDERVSMRDKRIYELEAMNESLIKQNKELQSEVIKNSYELRAILAQQTTTHPSSWTRSNDITQAKSL